MILHKGGTLIYGIIIVSHGNLAKGFRSAASMIVGDQDLPAIGLYPGHDLDYFEQKIKSNIIEQIEKYKKVIVFTDLMYGTPFNKVCMLMDELVFEHFTGTNLPLLLEALVSRDSTDVEEMVHSLVNHCSTTFIHVNDFLKKGEDE